MLNADNTVPISSRLLISDSWNHLANYILSVELFCYFNALGLPSAREVIDGTALSTDLIDKGSNANLPIENALSCRSIKPWVGDCTQ